MSARDQCYCGTSHKQTDVAHVASHGDGGSGSRVVGVLHVAVATGRRDLQPFAWRHENASRLSYNFRCLILAAYVNFGVLVSQFQVLHFPVLHFQYPLYVTFSYSAI